ncbi:MAG: hypothetical protein PVG93_04250, partial [Phycisphaerales bacterium]
MQLFEQLTAQPKKAWIAAGRIEASHEKYRAAKTTDESQIKARILQDVAAYQANTNKLEKTDSLQKLQLDATPFNTRYELSNEYTMNSIESVSYDGQRFYWDINIQSRTDSVKPDKILQGNYMTNQFNMELNAHRIFAWDGEKYIKYSPLAEHAFVDSANELPHNVNGPLTAGLIPWGYGYYSYNSLAALQSEATERIVDGNAQIQLTLTNSDGSQMSLVLDSTKGYAVLSCSITGRSNAVISKQYFDYQNTSGYWIPMSVLLEKYDVESQRLLARDIWTINTVDTNVPGDDSFEVDYQEDTLIEYASPFTNQPLIYRHS